MDTSLMGSGQGSGAPTNEDMDMGFMPMYFLSTWHTTLWFQQWEMRSASTYTVSLFGLLLLGIIHEGITWYRSASSALQGRAQEEPLVVGKSNWATRFRFCQGNSKLWITSLYAANMTTGYLLMLAVMSFNTGYFFAVIIGLAMGHYIFLDQPSSKVSSSCNDACHIRLEVVSEPDI